MLKIRRVPDRAALQLLIRDFDPARATWVVSDLRSKFEVQQRLLERDHGYLDTSVLRASDLWKTLLKRAAPAVRIVSRDFARSLVRHYLHIHPELLSEAMSENYVLSLMDRFAGIVFHPQGPGLLEEWFQQNPEAALRWKNRFLIAKSALQYFFSEDLVTAKWIAALLQELDEDRLTWDRPLVVDLGAELTSAESNLFRILARSTDVTLLEPNPTWRDPQEFLLRPYQDLEGFAAEIENVSPGKKRQGRKIVKRLSGQLAEVKETVSRVRQWMEAGVPCHQIAILAPEIEEYWPVLKPYLDEEGLPVDKPVAVKLNALPGVNRWLARLRPRRGELTPADLEMAYYSFNSEKQLRHEEFRALFAKLYGPEDLHRHQAVKEFFEKRLSGGGDSFPRDAFLDAGAKLWDDLENVDAFLLMAREVLKNATSTMELSVGDWIRYVEAIAANQEMSIAPAESGGLFVANFSSAHAHPATHRIFLGLSEEGLRKAERNPLPMKDIREISKLGFHLDHPDQSLLEFELKWLCDGDSEEDLLCVGVSSFDGSVRAPSSFWLRAFQEAHPGESAEALQLPGMTRWDQIQFQAKDIWSKQRGWSEEQKVTVAKRLNLDLGAAQPDPVKFTPPSKLSPSMVKNYLDCPFRVASSLLFRLKDLNELDVDVGRSDLGNLTHAVFQRMTDEDWISRSEVKDDEIQKLIQDLRTELKITVAEEGLWNAFVTRQVRVAQEFLRVERDWRKRFPRLKILKSEMTWQLWFNPVNGEFSSEKIPNAIELSGRLDRLETDGQNRYVVVDYKASRNRLHQHPSWLDENEVQLLFYMWALEKGGLPGIRGEVIGAFYYVYKDFSRDLGFQIEDAAGALFPSAGRKRNLKADVQKKLELFQALEEKIREIVQRSQAGDWNPKPHENNDQLCDSCNWNGLCRAPHLN